MSKTLTSLRRKGFVPAAARTVILKQDDFRDLAGSQRHGCVTEYVDGVVVGRMRRRILATAGRALARSPIVVVFPTMLGVETFTCVSIAGDGFSVALLDADGQVSSVSIDRDGNELGQKWFLAAAWRGICCAAFTENLSLFSFDEETGSLCLRPEFEAAMTRSSIDYGKVISFDVPPDVSRSFADFVVSRALLQIRIYETAVPIDIVADADDIADRLGRATKFVADDSFLDRVEALVERPELREKAGLLARPPVAFSWLELPHPTHDDGVVGYLVEMGGDRTAHVVRFERYAAAETEAGFLTSEFDVDLAGPNPQPEAEFIVAAFALLAAPGLFRRREIDPSVSREHQQITRKLRRLGVPNAPYVLVECNIDVDETPNSTGRSDTFSSLRSLRRRHRVRGFWRWRLSSLEYVREHFRGSEEAGRVEKRYRVTASGA